MCTAVVPLQLLGQYEGDDAKMLATFPISLLMLAHDAEHIEGVPGLRGSGS